MIAQAVPQLEPAALAAELFARHKTEIYAYLCRMMGDPQSAQDLAQETFLKAFQAGENLPEVQNRRAWLYRIATNLALNARKRGRRFTWLPWQAAEDGHVVADTVELVGRRSAVEQALAALPAGYRAPLLMYAHLGLSVAEVAEALGLSEGAVKTRLYRAREMFRTAYREGGEA